MNLDSETVVWAILDILIQCVFGFWLLLTHDSREAWLVLIESFQFAPVADSDSRTLYVDGFWSHGHCNEGAIRIAENEGA
jgi:bacteriorhodopsin